MAEEFQKQDEQESVQRTPIKVVAGAEFSPNDESSKLQSINDLSKKSKGWLIFSSINLLLIIAMTGSLFYLLQEVKTKQLTHSDKISKDDMREIEVSKQFNVFQSQLSSIQKQIVIFTKDVTGKDSHFTKTLADFSQLHTEKLKIAKNELANEISQIKRRLGKTRGDWLIADAEYLLTVANQRLHLMGDVNTAMLALEAADQRLRESGDTAVYKIRQQIVKEIAALGTVAVVDVVGIYSKIQLLQENSAQLAVLLPYADKPLTQSKQIHTHEEQETSEHGVLGPVLALLEGYVTVRHSDQPITQILTAEEVGFIRQQMKVKLEMLKIALVQHNNALYKASILDAKQWLNSHFTINTKAKEFLAQLDEIHAISMKSQLPNISQSFKMLKDIIKLRLEADKAQMSPENKKATQKAIVAPVGRSRVFL